MLLICRKKGLVLISRYKTCDLKFPDFPPFMTVKFTKNQTLFKHLDELVKLSQKEFSTQLNQISDELSFCFKWD